MSEIEQQVTDLLTNSGYTPMRGPPFAGLFCVASSGGYWMGGITGGSMHSAHTHMSVPPMEPLELAQLLVSMANPLSAAATLDPPLAPQSEAEESAVHESDGEIGEEAGDAAAGEQLFGAEAAVAPEPAEEPTAASDFLREEPATVGDDFTDADFTEDEPLDLGAELLEDETLDLPALDAPEPLDFAPDEIEHPSEPITYGASDFDALVREKLGRVSQIARELKTALQEGWTVTEFASLQNLLVRIERGEATDDPSARERFIWISGRSQAMSRVDAVRDAKEDELAAIAEKRTYAAAVEFDPESGWPE